MLYKADNKIIELFDTCTACVQRKGWLPLNTLLMGTECLFWSLLLAPSITDWNSYQFALLAMAALCLAQSYHKWQNAQGYWENHRKAQELNAYVLFTRDYKPSKIFRMCLALSALFIGIPIEILTFQLTNLVTSILLICLLFLPCCRYLGPGDYAKQRQTKLSGMTQMQ